MGTLGLTELEERVYLLLVRQAAVTARTLAESSGASPREVAHSIRRLRSLGLVMTSMGRPSRLTVTQPDTALTALIARRQIELDDAKGWAQHVIRDHAAATTRGAPPDMIELVPYGEELIRRVERIYLGAVSEIIGVDKPPYAPNQGPLYALEHDLLARGIRFRALYDQSALTSPGKMREIEEFTTAGEEARIVRDAPLKFFVADRRVAYVPLTETPGAPFPGIVIQSTLLAGAFANLFDLLWDRALPVRHPVETSDGAGDGPDQNTIRLLRLLAAGAKDDVIARELDTSVRTVGRQTAGLMKLLGASTRFQAGIQARDRRWV